MPKDLNVADDNFVNEKKRELGGDDSLGKE